jgi:hypothetical protein
MKKSKKYIQKAVAFAVLSLGVLQLSACVDVSNKQAEKTTMSKQSEKADEAGTSISPIQTDIITLNVMGDEISYDKVLEKAVVVGYDNAEIMAALDLQDHIIGLTGSMYRPEHCYPELYKKLEKIEVLPEGKGKEVPGFENVLSSGADFVYCLSYHLTADYIATKKDFDDNNIKYYITSGTYGDKHDIDTVYDDIQNIGKIFHVEDRAEKVAADYKKKVDDIATKVKDAEPVDVFVFDFQDKSGFMTPGGKSFQTSLLKLAGARNVFEDFDTDFDVATIEQIIQKNPEYIVLVEYWEENEAQEKIKYLESIPELADVTAIKNKNYIGVTGIEYFPSLHNVDFIENIAKTIHPEVFN